MADLDFVNSLYLNVLARDPDAAGATYWLGRISGGATYDEVRDAFLNSAEAQTFVSPVVRLYEGLFNRAPDAAGLKYWADALRGGASLNSITDAFLHSSEAQTIGFGDGVSNSDFVNKLYLGMGRSQAQIEVDPDGVNYWLNALNSNALSRAMVAQAFMESAENLQHSSGFVTGWATLRAVGNSEPSTAQVNAFLADQDFVRGLYLNVLARDPDAGGANYWAHQIGGGTTHATVTVAFLNSPEAQTFISPVVRLYEGLLNRAPDTEGLNYWADTLRGGASLTSITDAFLHSPEGATNDFGDNATNAQFVNSLYLSIGRAPAQIAADSNGFNYWLNALDSNAMSRAGVAQAFMESPENVQNSKGFVLGWEALRALGNPGPTTAQLNAFSDTATIDQIITSAATVGTSTTALPTGPGVSSHDLTDTAANLAAADPALLDGATNIIATTAATVEQAAIIDAATNSGTTTYDITDTADHLTSANATVLNHATNITVTDLVTVPQAMVIDAATNVGTTAYNVTDTASAVAAAASASTVLSHATNTTLTDAATIAQLVAIDAANGNGTLNWTALTDSASALTSPAAATYVIAGKAVTVTDAPTIAQLQAIDTANADATVSYTALADTAAHLDATTNPVAATYLMAGKTVTVTDAASIAQLHAIDIANGAAMVNYDEVTGSVTDLAADVATNDNAGTYVMGATAVTVTGSLLVSDTASMTQLASIDAATSGPLTVTLTGTGDQLSALAPEVLSNQVTLNADNNAIALDSVKFSSLLLGGGRIDTTDAITIQTNDPDVTNDLDLNGAGGAPSLTVVFKLLDTTVDNFSNFTPVEDTLQFSKAAFSAVSLPVSGAITADQFLSAAGLTADSATGSTYFLYDTDTGNLFYDADGAPGGAMQIAILPDVPALTSDDLVMIA